MRINFHIVILFLLTNTLAFAENSKKLVVSHIDHPTVEQLYLPLVQAMYKEANIEIELYYVKNSPRSIKGLNDGLIDADVGKILPSIENYPNIIYVPTPLAQTSLFLACAKRLPCTKSLLLNKYLEIASPYPKKIIQNITTIEAEVILISTKAKTTKMLKLGRVDYILFGDDTQTKMTKFQRHFKVIEIETAYIYHVLHKKHSAIIPKLNQALKYVIAKQQQSLTPLEASTH